ncbi:hypothetical protein HZA42_03435 [Candidatus Peregrinibacteria bacterium]|nr:hypothetical protein [Candidatus Peregrinibacteria bacterium]
MKLSFLRYKKRQFHGSASYASGLLITQALRYGTQNSHFSSIDGDLNFTCGPAKRENRRGEATV